MRSRGELAETVAEMSSPRAVGALAIAYRSEDTVVCRAATKGLHRLLPLVRGSEIRKQSPSPWRYILTLAR